MDIDRRALLIGGTAVAAGVVLGTAGTRLGWWDIDVLGAADPDRALRRVLRSGEANLIAAYDAALAEAADGAPVAERLSAVRQHHADHLSALGGGDADIEDADQPGRSDPADPESPPAVPALPGDPAQWPTYFGALEEGHAGVTATGVRISEDGGLARLLALVLASETGHVQEWADG
jgi:hypothetical protein